MAVGILMLGGAVFATESHARGGGKKSWYVQASGLFGVKTFYQKGAGIEANTSDVCDNFVFCKVGGLLGLYVPVGSSHLLMGVNGSFFGDFTTKLDGAREIFLHNQVSFSTISFMGGPGVGSGLYIRTDLGRGELKLKDTRRDIGVAATVGAGLAFPLGGGGNAMVGLSYGRKHGNKNIHQLVLFEAGTLF